LVGDPLHQQIVKGRNIVATEDPNLHLVWHDDRIYLKPVPDCLLNYDFWTAYLPSRGKPPVAGGPPAGRKVSGDFDRSVALGFLRSYAFLIQHRLDFILARDHHLIPQNIHWMKWSTFITHFRRIEDNQVARRYHYGQLRLSRLNWAVRIFRPRSTNTNWFYELPHWSMVSYVQRAIAPLIFVFASLSLILSSMQVIISVPADELGFRQLDDSTLQGLRRVFWVFPIVVLLLASLIWALLLVIPFSVITWQVFWGYKNYGKVASSRAGEA
jgi:hypothetical protein